MTATEIDPRDAWKHDRDLIRLARGTASLRVFNKKFAAFGVTLVEGANNITTAMKGLR